MSGVTVSGRWWQAAAFGAVLLAAVVARGVSAAPAPPAKATAEDEVLKRGQYLLTFGSCDDCHTPLKMGPKGPEPDMARRLSGHPSGMTLGPAPTLQGGWMWAGAATNTAFAGPWGISYAINLTPDPSGLGNWTEQMFVQALRTGKHAGASRPILPPMPWRSVAALSDADLHALFTALRHLPPVKNVPPPAVVAPPPGRPQ